MNRIARPNLAELISDGRAIDEAMKRAVRKAMLRHKLLGESVVGWRDGRVVIIPPEEIPVDDEHPQKSPQ